MWPCDSILFCTWLNTNLVFVKEADAYYNFL